MLFLRVSLFCMLVACLVIPVYSAQIKLFLPLARIIHDFKYDVVKTVFFVKLSTFSYF